MISMTESKRQLLKTIGCVNLVLAGVFLLNVVVPVEMTEQEIRAFSRVQSLGLAMGALALGLYQVSGKVLENE